MSFSEKTKREAKEKSNFKCVLCGSDIVEIHHIIPQEEGGPDTLDNAVALCASCHLIYGGNPLKREEIIEKRDELYKLQEKNQMCNFYGMEKAEGRCKVPIDPDNIVIFYKIKEKENFEMAANRIYNLIYRIQEENPYKDRTLILEIEGHRNKSGEYDNDMFELQFDFLIDIMFPYLHALHMPLISICNEGKQKKLPSDSLLIASTQEEFDELKKQYKKENKELIDLREINKNGRKH